MDRSVVYMIVGLSCHIQGGYVFLDSLGHLQLIFGRPLQSLGNLGLPWGHLRTTLDHPGTILVGPVELEIFLVCLVRFCGLLGPHFQSNP